MYKSIKRNARLLLVPLAIGSLLSATIDTQAQQLVRERLRPAFPQLSTGARQSFGQSAIDRLGARLPDVASWYGKSATELRNQLLSDHDARIDARGRMFMVEEMTAPLAAGTQTGTAQDVNNGQLSSLDQTFKLHSRPGANLTVYLDFVGATLTNTAWNSSGNTIKAAPFDIDGSPSTFSTDEQQRIQYIWQRVAEDYAPFDVDVTTEQPTADRLTRTDSSDQVYGSTTVITNNAGVYSCSCGGIAYVGVFNDTSNFYKPALVFYNMLGSGNEKYVAEAISHETGHNMGLSHDGATGTNATAYYAGQGTDPVTGWAPIMGVGYSKPLVQFSKGEYANANNKEDDFAVMQSYGLALRPDDYGNTIATATPFPGTGGGTVDGVIEKASDADVFSMTAGTGTFTASVSPANRSPDADLALSLLNSSGTVLASSSPTNALNASLSYNITAAGTYYVQVKGTGQGDPTTTGYSSYGSVGNYRLTTSFGAGSNAAPTPVLTASTTSGVAPLATTLDGSQSTDSDGTVKFYYWDFGDGTSDNTGTLKSTTKTYSSAGTYTVRLTVVDDGGASASTTKTITASAAAVAKSASAKSPTMALKLLSTGSTSAYATGAVSVVNQSGVAVSGATVAVTWSGIVSKTASATTNSLGKVSFSSPITGSKGCFTLTVTKITLSGYTFNQSPLPVGKICR